MRLLRFSRPDGTLVWINPDKVCYVHGPAAVSADQSGETTIGFAQLEVEVLAEAEEVVKKLTK